MTGNFRNGLSYLLQAVGGLTAAIGLAGLVVGIRALWDVSLPPNRVECLEMLRSAARALALISGKWGMSNQRMHAPRSEARA